ncbi:hypothetical protein, variant [Puccinia striiformis f. sp. tritici PST-78]|uniref:HAT C-terminal dimerisation domain-containing protein n=1 Tax=Puccinia striiformis f. sp. tritici PST-78 TaxID=1165861 RepID=A0A0L0VXL6_9BASI|nr:hypothetical protein, variant [Puccinia striiformis f. sp. tritici PST-78]
MSTRRTTHADSLLPQSDPEAIIRQANAEKRKIKADNERYLLGLANRTISLEDDIPTGNPAVTPPTTSAIPTSPTTPVPTQTTSDLPATNNPSITVTPAPSSRTATPPQPTFNPLDLPSPFLKRNMDPKGTNTGDKNPTDQTTGNQDASTGGAPMSTDDYLKVLFATQQASLAQAQANREEYARRLARQDADATARLAESASRIARLKEVMIGMTIKSQTPERQPSPANDDVNLRTFRTSDGPVYTGPYQEVEPFLLWLNSLDMFFRAKNITNEHTKIILTGGFIKESNLLGFFATDSKRLLDGTWAAFRTELMAIALPSRWQTIIRKQLRFFKMTTSESFPQFVARGRSLQLMLNFERTTVTDRDLAEGITFGLPDTVESDIYKLRLLEDSPFVFSEFVARATDSYNTTAIPSSRSRGPGPTSSTRTDTPFLPQDNYVWRIHSYLDSVGKCHYCKQHCGSTHGTCPGPVDRLKIHIPSSFVAPPKPTNYVAPTAWTKAQAASGKAPPPHLPAGRQTSRPAGVAGISDEEMWPEYDHLSEVALDAINAQATIYDTLALDKICTADDEAILAEFGELSFPPTVLSTEEQLFPEDATSADWYASESPLPPFPLRPQAVGKRLPYHTPSVPKRRPTSYSDRPWRQPTTTPTTTSSRYIIPARRTPPAPLNSQACSSASQAAPPPHHPTSKFLQPIYLRSRSLASKATLPTQPHSLARGEEAIPVQDGDSTEDDLIGDESACLGEEDIEHGSDEDEEGDWYTSESCKETLAKFRATAKKLRFSPNSKAEFVDICREKGCLTPHNIERDVRTRWNSTHAQLKSAIRCEPAILEWQRHKKYGVARKHYVDESDFGLARDLVEVLNVFHEITLQVSIASSARLSNVVVFIDQVTDQLLTAISNQKYPPALRNACRIGLKITNKYYSLTDSSPLYRIAILLHPSFRDEYFKMANWEPDWIAEAIRLARDMWVSHYKPRSSTTPSATPTTSTRPVTGLLAGLSSAAAACGGNSATDPFDTWLAGALVLHEGAPVNPLKWWIKQKRSGNTHGGLVEMALDVLSCPATSVDVERLFSFGSDYVTSRRHRLAPESVSRGMAVAFYSKNNKIAPGVLADWKDGLKLIKKANQKGKRKLIVVDDD